MSHDNGHSLTATLAAFFGGLNENALPEPLVRQAKLLLTDLVGVALGGSRQQEVAPIHRVFRAWGGTPEATVWNHGDRLPAHAAALVNGSFAHTLEMDDTHRFTYFHVGAVVIPAVMALGEAGHADGRRLLKALIAGYETALRIALSVSPEHRFQGFHTTATVGVFGAAMASAILLGLSPQQTINAMGLAGTQASGLFQFQFDGCSAKRFHPGRAAESGVVAAMLARENYSGSPEILEGRYGFCRVMSPRFDPAPITEGLGRTWHILEMGIKPYSACRFCHAPIDAVRKLRAHPAWDPSRLEALELVCSRQLYDQTGGNAPTSPMAAQFSTPNAMALALLVGSNTPYDVERHFNDPAIMALAERIKLTVDESLPRTSRQVRLVAYLRGTGALSFEVSLPTGEPENPMPPEAFRAKFEGLCEGLFPAGQVGELLSALDRVDQLEDVSGLAPLLVVHS